MNEYQAPQTVKKAALLGLSNNTRFRSMSRHFENMFEQYDEKTEIFITSQKNLEKEKQFENRAKTSANKFIDKGFDFFQHLSLNENVEEHRFVSLKIDDLKDFKRIIRDIIEEEKWYQFFSAIAEYDHT